MENYHLFIVDEKSLKFHVEYGFVGTGRSKSEFSIGLWKDIERLKIGDKIIFYAQNLMKFFGVFEVTSSPFFEHFNPMYLEQANPLLNSDENTYLRLKYRALIRPSVIYQNGIDEFETIDLLPVNSSDVLWSILYRKLKGGRGCSPLFPREFNIIVAKLNSANNNTPLNFPNYTFQNGQIVQSHEMYQYAGNSNYNVNLKGKILEADYQEHHLHALLLNLLPTQIFGDEIIWTGNEVYSGAGMQAIDLMSINQGGNQEVYNIIEVKKDVINPIVVNQVKKYSQWITRRFNIANPQDVIQPILIGFRSTLLQKSNRAPSIIDYNNLNISLPLRYFEYSVESQRGVIEFYEIDMTTQNFDIVDTFEI